MKTNLRARFWVVGGIIALAMVALCVRLANLQIRNSDIYGESAEKKRTKIITLKGDRGQIVDANGAILAYDKKIYNVDFYGEPAAGPAQKARNSRAIWEVIQLVEGSGKKIIPSFWLKLDEATGLWNFDFGDITESAAKSREKMWRSNFYLQSTDQQLLFDKLCAIFGLNPLHTENLNTLDPTDYLPTLDTEEYQLTVEDKCKILAVWQEMQNNAFLSKPIRVATDIDWATVIQIETRLISLEGMSVSVSSQRVYPYGTLACHVLGYIGRMQKGTALDTYTSRGYSLDDMIGLDGIEKSMEDALTPNATQRQGQRVVEVNRSGSIVREMSYTPPQNGNNVKLTIRTDLQRVTENALAKVISSIRDKEEKAVRDSDWLEKYKDKLLKRDLKNDPLKMADRGAIVVLDMQARVLAMASNPNFDPNLFILGMDDAQFERTMRDPRNPLFNNAIGSKDTPGSIFKMTTALAALTDGCLLPTDIIDDKGRFPAYEKDVTRQPKCWASEATRLAKHQHQTVVEGLQNSCNFFFYTIASKLGPDGEKLYQFAAKLGLTSKTNIDLPGEARSVVGCQSTLYDPTRAITEAAQDTAKSYLVKVALKQHLKRVGEKRNIIYSGERLDRAVKALMDMALTTPQDSWIRAMHPILMQELGMSVELVTQSEVGTETFSRLNEIRWGGSQTIQAAIGQSITVTTPLAIARYVVALANGGTVYDVSIVDSITSPSGEIVKSLQNPAVFNDLTEEVAPYLPYIKAGMKGVVDESGTAGAIFEGWPYRDQLAAKTGTAQKGSNPIDVENNAWFVSFMPYDKPEIVVVVYVPNGMSAGYAAPAAKEILTYYMDSKVDVVEVKPAAPNALAP